MYSWTRPLEIHSSSPSQTAQLGTTLMISPRAKRHLALGNASPADRFFADEEENNSLRELPDFTVL